MQKWRGLAGNQLDSPSLNEAITEHVVLESIETLEDRMNLQIPLQASMIYHILRDVDRWSLLDAIADNVSKYERDKRENQPLTHRVQPTWRQMCDAELELSGIWSVHRSIGWLLSVQKNGSAITTERPCSQLQEGLVLRLISFMTICDDSKRSEISCREPSQMAEIGMPTPALADLGTIRSRVRWDTQRGRIPGAINVYLERKVWNSVLIDDLLDTIRSTSLHSDHIYSTKVVTTMLPTDRPDRRKGFGTVSLVEDAHTHKYYAVKKIICHGKEDQNIALKEVEFYNLLKHPNIIECIDSTLTGQPDPQFNFTSEVLMILPYYQKGTLFNELYYRSQTKNHIEPQDILNMFLQICEGVKAFHEATPEPLAHRDLKTSNIVIADDRTPIIMDLGKTQSKQLATKATHNSVPAIGTIKKPSVALSKICCYQTNTKLLIYEFCFQQLVSEIVHPNTLEDNEPFLGFEVNDDPPMLDIGD
uniref:non-specific serine/threonine protein kinase n=1 Tax=Timema genevievae TaxID=629358 RepID=A0A7R9K5D9_TIMGE|nr:unnamed protein product [Timema genevievae]